MRRGVGPRGDGTSLEDGDSALPRSCTSSCPSMPVASSLLLIPSQAAAFGGEGGGEFGSWCEEDGLRPVVRAWPDCDCMVARLLAAPPGVPLRNAARAEGGGDSSPSFSSSGASSILSMARVISIWMLSQISSAIS